MDQFLKVSPCSNDRPASLRYVYDQICVHSRGLASLGVTSDQYGSLLIPVIMSKLPTEIRLQIARNSKDSVWKIAELLNVIKIEVEARETSEMTMAKTIEGGKSQAPSRDSKVRHQTPTANSLVSQQGGSYKIKLPIVKTNIILPHAMLFEIPLSEEIFWKEINDASIVCDLVTMRRSAGIRKNVDTANSGIISQFVLCLTKENRSKTKFLPKR